MVKKAALTLVSLLISLLFVEVILRSFFPIYTASELRAYEYDAELGVRAKSGIHSFETTDFQQELRVNKLGTVNFAESFDGYSTRVLAVGDSYTQGTGLPSDMSYPAQLDILLNSSPDGTYNKRVAIINLGLAAYGGEQNLIALKRYSESIGPPAFILYLGCDNDYQDDQLFKSGYRHDHIVDGSPKWGVFVRPLQWLTNDLQVGLRLKLIVGRLRHGSDASNSNSPETDPDSPSVAELERPVLEKVNSFARENGATMVVSWVGKPNSYEWTKQWAASNNVLFADYMPRVRSVTDAIPDMPLENQHSGGHYRGWVNRIIAEEFGRHIRSKDQ